MPELLFYRILPHLYVNAKLILVLLSTADYDVEILHFISNDYLSKQLGKLIWMGTWNHILYTGYINY